MTYSFVGDVVDQYAAISTAVKSPAQTSEFLLPRGVPNFEIDDFAVYDDFFLHEISSYSGFVRLQKLLVDVAEWLGMYALRRDVFPTAESPRMITLDNFFLLITYYSKNIDLVEVDMSNRKYLIR